MRSMERWAMAVVAICIFVHTVSAAPVISVEPANIEVYQGESFPVNITIYPGDSEIFSAEYKLYFDNTLLNAVDQSKGTFLSHDGANIIKISNNINNTIGVTEYGETRRTVKYGVNTTGILATITFNAIESGVCSLTLGDVVISDPNATEIHNISIDDGRCTITSIETGTPTPTATEPPSTGIPISTPTDTPTPAPAEPAATATATMVETAAADQTPPEPDSTASLSATPKQTMECPSDEGISGFTLILAMIGLLIALYAISKGKR